MAPLTELQQREMLDTLFPDQKDEPETTPIPREVVSSEQKQIMLDELFPEKTEEPVEEPLEEPTEEEIPLFSRLLADPYGLAGADIEELKNISDEFAWAEGLGPQLMQVFKNAYDFLKLASLESTRYGIVGPSGTATTLAGPIGTWTPEKQEEIDRRVEAESLQLIEDIKTGVKKVEELTPEDLTTFQEGLRSGIISFGMMAPLMVASFMTKSPTPMYLGMGFLTLGDSYTTGRVEGLSHREAMLYGGGDAIIEVATEVLPATFFLRMFGPAAKDAAGNFSKELLKFAFSDMAGEQAATWLQNLNAYQFDLDEQRTAIENDPNLNGLEKERLLRELAKQRAAVTAIATLTAGGLQVGVAKMVEAGFSEEEIQERLEGQLLESEMTEDELNQAYQDYADVQQILVLEMTPQEKVKVALTKTGEALTQRIQEIDTLLKEKDALSEDPDLKENPKKLKKAVKKKDEEIAAAEASLKNLERTQAEFAIIVERLDRIKEVDEEIADTEDAEIIEELRAEKDILLTQIKMEGPEVGTQERVPLEYTPIETTEEQPLLVLEDTPEAKQQSGKTGFFSNRIRKRYDETVLNNDDANRIVAAYNALSQKLAQAGFTSDGTVDVNAPKIVKELQKDLRRLLRFSKNLVNKRLALNALSDKFVSAEIGRAEYEKEAAPLNETITEIQAKIDQVVENSEMPLLRTPDLPETMDNPYGKKNRYIVPKNYWKILREKILPYKLNNTIVYRPTAKDEPIKDEIPAELEDEQAIPPQINFEDIPFDSTLRLYFYNMDGELQPLIDPLTGQVFSAEYDAIEFVDPLTGTLKLNENLLPSIELDGKTYQALWEPDTKSKAIVPMMNDPAMSADIMEQFYRTKDPRVLGAFWFDRFKSFFRPRGVRPTIMEELQTGPEGPIAKGKISDRQINYIFRDIAKTQRKLQENIEAAIVKIKAEIEKGVAFKAGDTYLDPISTMDKFKELIALSFRGNKDAQAELRRLGQTKLVEEIIKGRKRISRNSRRIIDLVKLIDPEGTYYTKEKIKLLEDSIQRYMGRIFGAYVFPDWRPPNRLAARLTNSEEWKQHKRAVEELAQVYADNQGISMEEATAAAERDLDILYSGTGQQRAEMFVEMFDWSPPYLSTDQTENVLVAPQLKAKRTDIPKEVRKALGEVTDSWAQAQMTAYKQEQFIAVTEYLFEIARIGSSPTTRFLSAVQTGRYSTKISVPGDVLNPLNGFFTTKAMAQAIMKTMGYGPLRRYMNTMTIGNPLKYTILSAQAATGWISTAYLTLSLKTQSRNFQSALTFPILSGNWQGYRWQNIGNVAKYMKQQFLDMSDKELDFIIAEGVTGSNVNIGERKALLDRMQAMTSWDEFATFVDERAESRAKKAGKKAVRVAEETYVAADDIAKIMNYLGERDSGYSIFYPKGLEYQGYLQNTESMKESIEDRIDMISELMVNMGGREFTRSENTPRDNLNLAIQKRASLLTRRNIPNYNRLPNVLDFLRSMFVSNFAGFPTAIMTSEANILKTAIDEYNLSVSDNPKVTPLLREKLKARAAMRGISNAAWMIGPGVLMSTASALRFATKVGGASTVVLAPYALSRFVSDWAVNNSFIFISDPDDEGVFSVVDTSHTDGYTLISEPLRLLYKYITVGRQIGPEAQEKIWGTLLLSLRNIGSTYTDERIMVKLARDLIAGYDREKAAEGKYSALYDPEDKFWVKWKKRAQHAADVLSPRIFKEMGEIGKAVVRFGEEAYDRNNQERSVIRALSQALGAKSYQIDPKNKINDYRIGDFKDAASRYELGAKSVFFRAEGGQLGYDDMDGMIAAYDELQRKHFALVKDLRLDIHWMAPALGTPAGTIINTISESGRLEQLSKTDRYNLTARTGEDPTFEPTSIKNFIKAYQTELLALQKKFPELTDVEINARVSVLGDALIAGPYFKWAQKSILWDGSEVLRNALDYQERTRDLTELPPPQTNEEILNVLFPED